MKNSSIQNREENSPYQLFAAWIKEAESQPGNMPTAMSLATVDKDNKPSSRIVLLKGWSEKGFVFYTNYTSRKAKCLEDNPNASLLFFWDQLGRQIRIEGTVKKIERNESEKYFQSRPIESQWGAWASKQSKELDSRELLESRYEKYKVKFPEDVPLPDFWGGYILEPGYFEFWETDKFRLHRRTIYKTLKGEWVQNHLFP